MDIGAGNQPSIPCRLPAKPAVVNASSCINNTTVSARTSSIACRRRPKTRDISTTNFRTFYHSPPLLQIPPPALAKPPNMPLPPLPVSKTRSRMPDTPTSADGRPGSSSSLLPTSNRLRSVTPSSLPTLRTGGLPTTTTTNTAAESASITSPTKSPNGSNRAIARRTISISSFPQPPKVTRSSTTPSPMSTPPSMTEEFPSATTGSAAVRTQSNPAQTSGPRYIVRSTPGKNAFARTYSSPVTPSLLNSIGQDKTISSAKAAHGLDALLHMPSPPESPVSSIHGSGASPGARYEDTDGYNLVKQMMRGGDGATMFDTKSSAPKDIKGNVIVSVRVRPDTSGGDISKVAGEWMVDGRRSLISYKGGEGGDYHYDNVFSPHDYNSRVYDAAAKRLVRRVMEGYHGTVFAYGMTGTGKTFSMQGTAQSPGVIPLAITDIFSYIRENPDREFLLRVSYLEIYNERIYDLLSPNAGGVGGPQQEEIKLREDSKRGVYAAPLKEEIVQSPTQLLRVIARGDQARRTGSTQFNARSSRSHAVVQIVVESRERAGNDTKNGLPGGVLVSTLSLIDLAGSETAAETKERRTEGSHINKSLLTLGTVISRLSSKDEEGDKGRDQKHLPYRDSKLTRLLQPALSGGSLVSILCTVSLASPTNAVVAHTGETLNTLGFASRAKNNIVSHAKRNESHPAHAGGAAALLDRYRLEIDDLKRQLDEQNKAKAEAERAEEEEEKWKEREREAAERHEEQMLEMHLARTALKERISHLNRLILSSKSVGVNGTRFEGSNIPRSGSYGPNAVGVAIGSPEFSRQNSVASVADGMSRSFSYGTTKSGSLPVARVSQMMLTDGGDDDEDEPLSAGSGDGNASLTQQVSALQADLADKNRYISTLERRLLQARRTSHSRPSLAKSGHALSAEDVSYEERLAEKDRQLDELRAKLDDQTKMVNALRSAARTRDMLGGNRRRTSSNSTPIMTSEPIPEAESLENKSAKHDMASIQTNVHRSQTSAGSIGNKSVNFSRLTSPSQETFSSESQPLPRSFRRQESLENMTRMLDNMMQHKVGNGEVGAIQVEAGAEQHDSLPVLPRIVRLSAFDPTNVI